MKKFIAILSVSMMLFTLVGCAATPDTAPATPGDTALAAPDDTAPAAPDDTVDVGDDRRPLIGVIWWGITDPMGATFYAWSNHAAELLGVDLIWAIGSVDTASQLADAENLIAAGVDAFYFIPMDIAANLLLGQVAESAGVYWAISNRDIPDAEIWAAVEENPYFVTHTFDTNYEVSVELVSILAELGITRVGMIAGDPSDPMMIDRNRGFIDGTEQFGIEILGTFQSSVDTAVVVDGVTNFLTLFPDMEGILAVSATAGVGEAIISTLEGSGREQGSIRLAAFDTFAGNQQAFDDGWLVASCGGYTAQCLITLISLINRVKGNVISDRVFQLTQPPLFITSAEDMEIFARYVDNPEIQLFSDELILSLIGPDVTAADYQAVLDNWTIDFVRQAVSAD